jgi:hypothetical protein
LRKCKFSQRRIAEVNDNSSSSQDHFFNNSFPRRVNPDNQIPQVDKSEPLTAVRGSLKGSHNNNGVGEAYVYGGDGSSFSGMGISSLADVTNEAVMSGCESHKSMSNDDRNKDDEFIYGDKEQLVRRINGRFYYTE